jgi:HEPN domain-containing protein
VKDDRRNVKLNRHKLQEISRIRRREARALLKAGHYAGAYYLAGYSIECALKACIAKQTERHEFPNKKLAMDAYTHNIEILLNLSGLAPHFHQEVEANTTFAVNWAVVKDWSEQSRYDSSVSEIQARDLYSACTARKHGVLSWIRQRW